MITHVERENENMGYYCENYDCSMLLMLTEVFMRLFSALIVHLTLLTVKKQPRKVGVLLELRVCIEI